MRTSEQKSANDLKVSGQNKKLFLLEQYPYLDLEASKKIFGESYDLLLPELLKTFVDSVSTDKAEITQAMLAKDWQRVHDLAHKIKGGAEFCSTIRMRYACVYLEEYSKKGYSELLELLFDQLMQVMDETQDYVDNWLKETAPH